MKQFASEIYAAVQGGKLREPFGPEDVRQACPGWSPRTYTVFLQNTQSEIRVRTPSCFGASSLAVIGRFQVFIIAEIVGATWQFFKATAVRSEQRFINNQTSSSGQNPF